MRRLGAGEVVRYARTPGIAALPEGGAALFGFALLQIFPILILLWAIWWPWPQTPGTMAFALICTGSLAVLSLGVLWFVVRPRLMATARTLLIPFIRLTVTDRRVTWTLPWKARPLMEIEGDRVVGGLAGPPDRRGWAPAAILLFPDDPAGDEDGMVRFDRIPDAARFVEAVRGLA